jgi:predicted ATPase/class 3 adenylate cyclase
MTISRSENIPEKTYSFLFTDVEGSTRLWEQYPQQMSEALAKHNAILTQAIEAHHGTVFKNVGDGFCAVFDSASDSLNAAIAVQRALAKGIEQPIQLKVRIGIHLGAAEKRDNDYFGSSLNRVARLMGVASGGQILISSQVKAQLTEQQLSEIEFRDLGKHNLRDISEAMHLFQIVVVGLQNSFPPIKTLSVRPSNLPAELSSFVGREAEIEELANRLRQASVRLLTLVGPGGIGKTRLSLQVASRLREEHEDGVFFVALATVSQADALIENIARALKIEENGSNDLLDMVNAYLQKRQLLLVLDNFEQVVDAAPLLNQLLAVAPRLKILVSSREELLIYGEQIYPIAPLAFPKKQSVVSIPSLMNYAAIRLFVERIQALDSSFVLDEGNMRQVIEICQSLEGLPLAIELVAVRIRELDLAEILQQLSKRLEILNRGPRDLSSRQRTMRGAIDWSYQLLSAEEQDAFMRLAVFVGPFTVEAADKITGVEHLNRLKEKSLVHQLKVDENELGLMFLMLETLREFGLERLNEDKRLDALQKNHADYYAKLVESAEPHLTGSKQVLWFKHLERETLNIQAALEWFLRQNLFEEAGTMVAVLWRFWGAHSHLKAGSNWMKQVLLNSDSLSAAVHARVRLGAGRLALLQADNADASEHFQISFNLYEQLGDIESQATVGVSLGEIACQAGNNRLAKQCFENSLLNYHSLANQAGVARCLDQLGRLAAQAGDLKQAETLFDESLRLTRQSGSTESIAIVGNDLAEVLRSQGRSQEAALLYHESLNLYRELDFAIGMAVMQHNLGQVTLQIGNAETALHLFREALNLLQNLEEKQLITECLAAFGAAYMKLAQAEPAIYVLSAAQRLMDSCGIQLNYADQSQYLANRQNAKLQVSEAEWAKFWAKGQTTSLEQIIADLLVAFDNSVSIGEDLMIQD